MAESIWGARLPKPLTGLLDELGTEPCAPPPLFFIYCDTVYSE